MELFRLAFDVISKYLNISVTFHSLIAWELEIVFSI